MNRVTEGVAKVKLFVEEVRTELRKSAWPDRSELVESTVVLIVSVVLLSIFVGLGDGLLATIVNWIM